MIERGYLRRKWINRGMIFLSLSAALLAILLLLLILVHTLLNLHGNPKYSVYTEALWGIPYNLVAPYVSVYMLTLGLKDNVFRFLTLGEGNRRRWVFYGRGWGHGVGLCQTGAYGMALEGATFQQILSHYYPGTELRRVD